MSSETTSSIGYNIERLTDHNYRSWAQQMELIFDEKELWEVVNCPPTSATISAETATTATMTASTADLTRKRKRAVVLIVSTVSSGVLVYLRGEKDPSAMWTILKDRYAPRTRITCHQILRRFTRLQMKDDDDLQEHLKYVQNLKIELKE
jgi:gag-polypeptide of LTR copia-type